MQTPTVHEKITLDEYCAVLFAGKVSGLLPLDQGLSCGCIPTSGQIRLWKMKDVPNTQLFPPGPAPTAPFRDISAWCTIRTESTQWRAKTTASLPLASHCPGGQQEEDRGTDRPNKRDILSQKHVQYWWDHSKHNQEVRKKLWAEMVERLRRNKGEEVECESVRERDEGSGSSQRSEATHTYRRELSQQPLAHTAGTRQDSRLSLGPGRKNRHAEGSGSQWKQAAWEQTTCHKLSPVSQRKQAVRKQTMGESRQRGRAVRQQAVKKKQSKNRQLEHRL